MGTRPSASESICSAFVRTTTTNTGPISILSNDGPTKSPAATHCTIATSFCTSPQQVSSLACSPTSPISRQSSRNRRRPGCNSCGEKASRISNRKAKPAGLAFKPGFWGSTNRKGNIDTQLHRQLRGHARLSPSRILLCHLHDEVADVLRNSWPTSLRLPFPKQLETLALPADQGLGFDNDQGLFPIA